MLRVIAVLFAGLLFGGCVPLVYSRQPLFGSADAAGEPGLRTGIWESVQPGDECKADPSKPLRRWKACTDWFLVRSGDLASLSGNGVWTTSSAEVKGVWTTTSYVAASGTTITLQLGPDPDKRYTYLSLMPLLRDEGGRVTSFKLRGALCGPPNDEAGKEKGERQPNPQEPAQFEPGTLAPLPGLELTEDGQNCWASDAPAVRRAVAFAEEHPDWGTFQLACWVRDVRPDDFARRQP